MTTLGTSNKARARDRFRNAVRTEVDWLAWATYNSVYMLTNKRQK